MRILLFAVLLASIVGCFGDGFTRHSVNTRFEDSDYDVTEEEILEAMAKAPQVKYPASIAIALAGDAEKMNQEQKQALYTWGQTLVQDGIATDVNYIHDLRIHHSEDNDSGNLRTLRVAAAKQGADLLVVIGGDYEASKKQNFASILNITILGGFLIPGSTCKAEYTMKGIVMDVGNGYLYASTQSTGSSTILRPSFTVEESEAIDAARGVAAERIGPNFVEQMRQLHAKAMQPGR